MDACVCMTQSLCCLPETITTLLIGHITIQNKKFNKTNKKTKVHMSYDSIYMKYPEQEIDRDRKQINGINGWG